MWLVPGLLLLASFAVKSYSANAPLFLFVAAGVAYFVFQARYERWRCPRCGERFQRAGRLAPECVACGLPKWSGLQ